MLERVNRIVHAAFGGVCDYFSGLAGQELCDVATFSLPGGLPAFFKKLQNFVKIFPQYGTGNVLFIDNKFYPCHFNPPNSYIVVPGLQDRHGEFLFEDLQEVLAKWHNATDQSKEAFTFDNVEPSTEDNYVKAALQHGGKTTTYQKYLRGPQLMPMYCKL